MKRLLATMLFLLAGCSTTTPDIVLRNRSGQTVRCPGFVTGFFYPSGGLARTQQRECVEDYQRAGYERVPDAR